MQIRDTKREANRQSDRLYNVYRCLRAQAVRNKQQLATERNRGSHGEYSTRQKCGGGFSSYTETESKLDGRRACCQSATLIRCMSNTIQLT